MKAGALAILIVLAGCATIEHYETPKQAIGKTLSAGIGDVVLRIDKSRDLTNVAGKADLWGRKTNEGHTEVRYLGAESDGTLVFSRRDVDIVSNETTVTRMGFVPVPTYSTTNSSGTMRGSVGQTPVQGNYTGTSTTTGVGYVPVAGASTIVVPNGEIPIRVAPGRQLVRVSGYVVKILQADGAGLEYQVEGLQ